MTRLAVFPSKRPDESLPLQFSFGDQLQFGETISGQAITSTVFAGEDPLPADILFGAPTLAGSTITQVVLGGIPGVIYQLVCIVSGSMGHVYTKGGKLAIAADPGAFTGPV